MSTLKKIAVITYNFDNVTAGPTIRFKRYAPLFVEKGYKIVFVCPKISNEYKVFEQTDNFNIMRIKVRKGPMSHSRFIASALIKTTLEKTKPSAILLFGINAIQSLILPIPKIRKIKLIYINTMQFSGFPTVGKNLISVLHNTVFSFLYRHFLLPNLNYIVCSSDKLGIKYLELGVPQKNIVTIFNGVDQEVFHPVSKSDKLHFIEKLSLPKGGFRFLFVGLRIERKGIKDLIESWERYFSINNKNSLILVGNEKLSANQADFNNWWKITKEKIKSGSIKGVILRDGTNQIHEYFKASDVFVFLSKLEGMPNVLLEAMSTGLPVILTKFEGFSDVYGGNNEEYVLTERDSKTIAKKLQLISDDTKFYEKIKTNSIRIVNEKFKVGKSIDSYLNLINS